MPNIRDVALACGVSPMTVSFVINNKTDQVSEQTRAKVLQAIREMGYRPAALERKLETPRVRTIGVVTGAAEMSLVTTGYYSEIFKGVLAMTEESVNNILVFPHALLHQDVDRAVRTYCDGRCDGLIIIAPHYMHRLLDILKERGFPFVAVSHLADDPTVNCVDIDNWSEGERAFEYLYAHGHRRMGMVAARHDIPSAQQRRDGFVRAMNRHGISERADWFWGEDEEAEDLERHARELAAMPKQERPTAIFCWNDRLALYWLAALPKAGLHVPEDISILGFDDGPGSASSSPPLTTFRQPYEAIGRKAAEMALAHIADLVMPFETVLFRADLIERSSVKTIGA